MFKAQLAICFMRKFKSITNRLIGMFIPLREANQIYSHYRWAPRWAKLFRPYVFGCVCLMTWRALHPALALLRAILSTLRAAWWIRAHWLRRTLRFWDCHALREKLRLPLLQPPLAQAPE